MDGPRPQRNRVHIDVAVPHGQAEGGRLVSDEDAPEWWTLADAEGNEVDVANLLERH
jgi:4a-hydroxytetrahydrobiopterin dehydratase